MEACFDMNGRSFWKRDKMMHDTIDFEDCNLKTSIYGDIYELEEGYKKLIGLYITYFIEIYRTNIWHDLHEHFLHVGEETENTLCYKYKVIRIDFITNEYIVDIVSIPVIQIIEQLERNNPIKASDKEIKVNDNITVGYKGYTLPSEPETYCPHIPNSFIKEELNKAYDRAKKMIV